jgi:LysM repeat protein
LFPNSLNIRSAKVWETPPLFGKFKAIGKLTYGRKSYNQNNNGNFSTNSLEKEITFWIIPKNLIINISIVLILILVLISVYFIRKKILIKSLSKYTIKKGETLNSIAKIYKIDWKLLAKINNINPPFEVKAGQIIFIPTYYLNKKIKLFK